MSAFGFLTVLYFSSKYYFFDKKGPEAGSKSFILSLLYILLVVGSQLYINVRNSAALCNNTPQMVSSFIYTLIPNFFILGFIIVIMKVLPGWKAPFSNTFGYGLAKMMGAGGALNDLLKDKKVNGVAMGELIQKICDNKSIIINEMTPLNFKSFLKKMNTDNLLKTNYAKREGYKTLWNLVVMKDSFAEFMWVSLCGTLVISTTYNALLEISCNIPIKQRKAAAAELDAAVSKSKAAESKPKLFSVKD